MRRAACALAMVVVLGGIGGTCRADGYSPHYVHVDAIYNHFGHLDYHPWCSFIGHDRCIPVAPIPPCPYGGANRSSYGASNGARYVYPNRAPRDFWMYH